ncbi:MAG: GNAT family N-acetyltransferase [Methanobacteriota archaeon]|nr:MAG: GNAT family N-acetyltransferase [Euryarchaeota archaeon]
MAHDIARGTHPHGHLAHHCRVSGIRVLAQGTAIRNGSGRLGRRVTRCIAPSPPEMGHLFDLGSRKLHASRPNAPKVSAALKLHIRAARRQDIEGRLTAAWEEPNRVRGEEVLVAELDGHVVGCVTVEERGRELELININVPMDLQGRGIGTALVRFVEGRARREGKAAVTLGTSRNAAGVAWKSLPWWRHLGYRITHEEENEWTRRIGPGAREIRMRKDLL